MGYSDRKTAGAILFAGALQFVIGFNFAEDLYPGYSVSMNYISDLGATCDGTCNIVQPSSTIFNSSVTILGLLVLSRCFSSIALFGRSFCQLFLFWRGSEQRV